MKWYSASRDRILCFLGNEEGFIKLSKVILELTDTKTEKKVDIISLDFIQIVGDKYAIYFSSKRGGNSLGTIQGSTIHLELDCRYWDRIFQFSALLSWEKTTYYLNNYEDGLKEFDLIQDCHLIWSSEF